MAVDALLIDVDGTLIDSNPLHTLAWLRAFRRLVREVEANRVLHLIGMGGDQLAPTILGEEAGEEHDRAKRLWTEEYSERGLVDHADRYQAPSTCCGSSRSAGSASP